MPAVRSQRPLPQPGKGTNLGADIAVACRLGFLKNASIFTLSVTKNRSYQGDFTGDVYQWTDWFQPGQGTGTYEMK